MSEIIVIVGYPAAGKSSLCKEFEDQGYMRVNRDTLGGTLKDLAEYAKKLISEGKKKLVLDNTYGTIESRKVVIELGKETNIPVRCVWLDTSIEDSQFNACMRMMQRFGKVLAPDEIKKKKDPNTFPAAVQFKYRKAFEKPKKEEGFTSIEKRKFERVLDPEYCNSALILDYDGCLRETKSDKKYPTSPDDIRILPGRGEKLKKLLKDDPSLLLLGASNQSGIAKGVLSEEDARACFDFTNKELGVDIEYRFCPHKVPPISCFCRKPMPGIGVYFVEKYKLNPEKVTMVGDMKSDETFAKRCGFKFIHSDDFFKV